MATFAYRELQDGIVVLVGTASPPDAATWNAHVQGITANKSQTLRVLVFTDGGRPTREQVSRIEEAVGSRYSRTVVISSSVTTRLQGSLVNASSRSMHGSFFPPEAILEALTSIEIIDPDQMNQVCATAVELAAEVAPGGRIEALGSLCNPQQI